MTTLDELREALPEAASDARLNLQAVLENNSLETAVRWGVAAATALACRNKHLSQTLLHLATHHTTLEILEDAKVAASVMSMNNILYRFRHTVGKPSYGTMPARLRMNKLRTPKSNAANLELFCLAVSAIHGCEACVQSHEKVVLEKGLSEEQVLDAVRIASVVHAVAVSLEIPA